MSGVLYIVATPIGNLDDISLRAIEILKSVDLVAAEDTRHSKGLLDYHGIRTRLVSCHEHNESKRSAELIGLMLEGRNIALVSDAGTPLISDPGYLLVRGARNAGIVVSPIPGANSVVAALSASGLPTDRFYFCGFLSSRSQQRRGQLEALREVTATLVLLESSHRIEALLAQAIEVFPQHACVIGKELTKLHEQFLSGSPVELLDRLRTDRQLQKGEFVLLIDNSSPAVETGREADDSALMRILLDQVPVKTAVNIATQLTATKKNELYELALRLQGEIESAS